MSYGRCSGCGRKILWVKTTAGKNMPCDPGCVAYWPVVGARGKVVRNDGSVVSCEFIGPKETAHLGYTPHWSTCPKANKFKRKKECRRLGGEECDNEQGTVKG